MAVQPGEEVVATCFADVHYFYAPPEVKPLHHRFDKGSYVYLFENANERRCRIEVANNAGTDDQDAFDGFLDQTRVRYSYKHGCMVSLTAPDKADQDEWHLPTYDPHNQNKYHYKLHSLDLYFWTQQDALLFVNGVRMVLPPTHLEILDEPPPPPQPAPLSSLVQNLENVAISDPQYGSPNSTQPSLPSFAPPPTAPAPSTESPAPAPASFAPIPYNPAAPAAPEAIQYREKTPPPPEDDAVNPLAAAVAYDYQKQQYGSDIPPHAQYGQGGMQSPGLPPPQFGGPPQHPGLQRAQTMPVQQPLGSPYGSQFPPNAGFTPPPPPQSQPPVAAAQAPPPGGYSQYSYSQQTQLQPAGVDYGVHHQVYRPTESEMTKHAKGNYEMKPGSGRGRLEENAGRLERGVTGMFKKFEKKFG